MKLDELIAGRIYIYPASSIRVLAIASKPNIPILAPLNANHDIGNGNGCWVIATEENTINLILHKQ